MWLSWCIYQTRIVRKTKKLTWNYCKERCNKILTERVFFYSFRTGRYIIWSPNFEQEVIISDNDLLFHLNEPKQWKIAWRAVCCAKNELTIGLVYTEKMIDTQMSWLHILVKDRGSSFIVILKTFLQGKFFCFSLWPGSTC